MYRPRVGLTTLYNEKVHPEKLRYYREAIERAGAEVVILHPDTCTFNPKRLAQLDGFVLGGGGDVHPRYYGEDINGTNVETIHEGRDAMEFRLLEIALERDMPVLAICRGFQVLNILMGGKLIQHIPGHKSPSREEIIHHLVRVVPNTLLWEAMGRRSEIVVNSHHHQGLTPQELAPRLRASAHLVGDLPLIEGIESKEHRWVVGVQWHPERLHEFAGESRQAQEHLFRAFVQECARVTA
ncbi:MAG: gamma-glutamyl-gamma-aminobutyrate hydrolase family protein [Chloroflexi bacterium]|nr:gamma-glutamyl-gamma-aminobutyrate hydrolase family protein [Chloroflexota bacterium]